MAELSLQLYISEFKIFITELCILRIDFMYSHLNFLTHTLGQRCKSVISQLSDLHHMIICEAWNFYFLLCLNTEALKILNYLPHSGPFSVICLHLLAQVICVDIQSSYEKEHETTLFFWHLPSQYF